MRDRRDFAAEVADAIEVGDMRRLRALAIEMAGKLSAVEDKKARDRTRKARNSTDSTESPEFQRPPLPSLSSPTPLLNPSFPPVSSSTSNAPQIEEKNGPGQIVGAIVGDVNAYAVGLCTAANNANTKRWGEQPLPIRWDSGHSLELAEELVKASVPLELARSTIAAVIAKSKNRQAFRALSYFRNAIFEAQSGAVQRGHDRSATAPGDPGGARAAATEESERRRQLEKLRDVYDGERKAAVLRWRLHPDNAAEVNRMNAEADRRFKHVTRTVSGRMDRLTFLATEEAAAVAFPPFEEWARARDAQPPPVSAESRG